MEQGLVPSSWLARRVSILEQDQARMAAYEEPDYQWNFQAAVSCPPSTTIHMRGGQVWADPTEWGGLQWYVDSASYDLSDEEVTGYTYTFTNAYYYLPVAVHLRWAGHPDVLLPDDPPIKILDDDEQPTAAEAEQIAYRNVSEWLEILPDLWYGFCLGIFIMRNNGNIGEANQFMPIDAVNRDRSYLWRYTKTRFFW